ncbi:hypothetical protein FS837_000382 [Tulasnella sp. UAMH 9824]|nr:hypothetical protein FS837_000382 [Tulasnella sp. UAMH 9824]
MRGGGEWFKLQAQLSPSIFTRQARVLPAELLDEFSRVALTFRRFEFDTWAGEVSATKNVAHGGAIIHIWRYKNAMVTIDEKGKALVFGSPDSPTTVPAIAEGKGNADQDGWTDVAGGMNGVLLNTTRSSEKEAMSSMAITTVKRGMGGHYGNKGAIVSRFLLDNSSFCFINCHLAAGQSEKAARNSDLAAVLEERSVFPEALNADQGVVFTDGGDGSMILDHEFVFLNGDLNYRIDQRREAVISSIRAGDLQNLLGHDQLLKEMTNNRAFRLRIFHEAPITFLPTYKYDRHSNEYDTSEKRRIPACPTKEVDYAARGLVESEVSRQWLQEERKLVQQNRLFYAELGWI